MKKKVLLSSIATIALCFCLITGSTFALFTDTTEFNVAVTSGDVEIELPLADSLYAENVYDLTLAFNDFFNIFILFFFC